MIESLRDLPPAVTAFLEEPRMARVSTVNADGSPHVVPMWYCLDGDALLFTTRASRVTIRNIERDGRVAVVVDDDAVHRYRGVVAEGIGEIVPDRAIHAARTISHRYLDPAAGDRYAAFMLAQPDRTAFRVLPTRCRHWGVERPDTVARLLAGETL